MNIIIILISCITLIFTGCARPNFAVKTQSNNKNSVNETFENNDTNYKEIFDALTIQDKNNSKQIKKNLKLLSSIDLQKLHEVECIEGKMIPYYELFYNYQNHDSETIEDIIKIRERATEKNQWDRLIFDLYKEEKYKSIFEMIVKSTPKYKNLLDNIIETETKIHIVYDWGISENKNDKKQIEKVLRVIGSVDFNKLWDMQINSEKKISFYTPFYNYPNHDFETIKNIFDAKTDGAISEEFSRLIFNLYKKKDVKPIIEKLILSDTKYKKKLDSIIEFESQ